MTNSILKALTFLRIVDDSHNLSLTNIAVWIAVVKLGTAPGVDYPGIAALLGTLASYQTKRYLQYPGYPGIVETGGGSDGEVS